MAARGSTDYTGLALVVVAGVFGIHYLQGVAKQSPASPAAPAGPSPSQNILTTLAANGYVYNARTGNVTPDTVNIPDYPDSRPPSKPAAEQISYVPGVFSSSSDVPVLQELSSIIKSFAGSPPPEFASDSGNDLAA